MTRSLGWKWMVVCRSQMNPVGNFRLVFCLCFKARRGVCAYSAKPFTWKLVLFMRKYEPKSIKLIFIYERLCIKPETEANENFEIVYCVIARYYSGWSQYASMPFVLNILTLTLTPPSSGKPMSRALRCMCLDMLFHVMDCHCLVNKSWEKKKFRSKADAIFLCLSVFQPIPGADGFQISNPPVLQTVSLLASLNVSWSSVCLLKFERVCPPYSDNAPINL